VGAGTSEGHPPRASRYDTRRKVPSWSGGFRNRARLPAVAAASHTSCAARSRRC
jgi:hypothetical protein